MLTKAVLSKVQHHTYWENSYIKWSIKSWDEFYLKEYQNKTERISHNVFAGELKKIIDNSESKRVKEKALRLYNELKDPKKKIKKTKKSHVLIDLPPDDILIYDATNNPFLKTNRLSGENEETFRKMLKSSHYMSHQSAILGGGLESYKEGLEVDPELVLQESDIDEESTLLSTTIPYFFDRGTWEKWTLKSGLIVSEKLKSVASTEGHPLRPEVWNIVRCGFKISKPNWCNDEEYAEIQQFTRRPSIINPPEPVIRLLKLKSPEFLKCEIDDIIRNELNKHSGIPDKLNEVISKVQLSDEDRRCLLEEVEKFSKLPLQDPYTALFTKILSLFHRDVFPENSVMQQAEISEADYGGYIIHPCLKICLSGLENFLHYHMGEIILSSVESCRKRRKCSNSFEQKADGVFSVQFKKSFVEIGHLEMSGGHGHIDIPRATWDGCCKLPIGNLYMLEEIGERFRGATIETFSKLTSFSLHTYENRIELWRMHNPARGILQYERSHKAIVPICFDERKNLFDFVVVLWDLRCDIQETARMIYKMQEEHNNTISGVSELSRSLPVHPFTPKKDAHKKGINIAHVDSDPESSPICGS